MPRTFSGLDRYILISCLHKKRLLKHEIFFYFGENSIRALEQENPRKYQRYHSTILKRIDALIRAGYLIGYGWRTQKEWHFRELKLTREGKKTAAALERIRNLPLKMS